ncbi:MAG: glycosyltransferase involved in cell wall biosynthesis [Bacteroidia bacterium]|jgi:glycosyltransferase involved in cell wall biosynthesis
MRIGFDAKRYFKNETGLGNYSRTLVDGLAEASSDNDFVLFTADKKAEKKKLPHNNQYLSTPKRKRWLWRQLGMSDAINREKIDVYHGLSAELPMFAPKAKKVVTIHDIIFLKYPKYYKFIDRVIYTFKTKQALLGADAVVFMSKKTQNDVYDIFKIKPKKSLVIYQDCHQRFYKKVDSAKLEAFKIQVALPTKFIVCVSAFDGRKNQQTLVEAFAKIDNKDLHLVLVGKDGGELENIRNQISEQSLSKRVHIYSDVSSKDLPFYYHLSVCSIFPSFYEGFGIPAAESLAMGKVVLTAKDSSMAEIVGSAGAYFDPNSAHEIAECININTTEPRLAQLKAAIPKQLDVFSSLKMVADHMALYKELS